MAPPPLLHLYTLGCLELRRPDGTSAGDGAQPKPLALLAFLATAPHDAFHRRDTLVCLLWPELDQAHARAALRKALHHLRNLDPRLILTRGDEEVRVDPDVLWCDAREFRRLAAAGAHAEALARYTGDFLPGLHISEAPEFAHWLDHERHGLRQVAADGALTLAHLARKSGESAEAIRWATRAVDLSPLEERPNRLLIEVLDAAGDRAAALGAYHRYRDRLLRDLGVEPAPETSRMADRLRKSADERGHRDVALPHPEPGPSGRPSSWIPRTGLIAAGVLAVAAAAVLPGWIKPVVYDPERLVIVPWENRTGDSTLHDFSAQLLAHLTDTIAREGVAEPVSVTEVRDLLARARGSPGEVAERLARETRSGLALRGECNRAPRGTTCQLELLRMPAKVLRMTDIVAGDPADPAFTAELTERGLVMLYLQQTWGDRVTWLGEYLPRSLAAVKAFKLAGNRQSRPQRRFLGEAARLDTAWVLPAAWAALDSSDAVAESILARLASRPDLLESQREELGFVAARRRRQAEQAFQLARKRFEANPEWWHYPATYWAEFTGRSAAAVAFSSYADSLRDLGDPSVLPQRVPTAQEYTYTMRGFALHHLARYRDQLDLAHRFARWFPTQPLLSQTHEAMALAGLGEVDSLRRRLAEWEATPEPAGRAWAGSRAYVAGMELLAHGKEQEGRAVLTATVPLYRRLRVEDPSRLLELIEVLVVIGRLDEAREEALLNLRTVSSPDDSTSVLQWLGIIAARQGADKDAARYFAQADRYVQLLIRAGEQPGATLWRRAIVAGWRGEREQAVRLLEEARAMGGAYTEYRWVHREPAFAGLHDYPPFQRFLKPGG